MKTKKLPVLISNFIFGKEIKSIKRSLYELKDCFYLNPHFRTIKLKDYEKILQYFVKTCCILNFGANADAMDQIAKLM